MLMLRTMITMESQISLNLNAGRGTDLYIYTLLVRIVFYPGLKAGFYQIFLDFVSVKHGG